jgi:hypothetical protein
VKASILFATTYQHEKEQCEILQGIIFSQITLAVKNEIKNLSSATTDLVISLSPSTRKQAHLKKKSNPAINAKHKWLSGCACAE